MITTMYKVTESAATSKLTIVNQSGFKATVARKFNLDINEQLAEIAKETLGLSSFALGSFGSFYFITPLTA